MKISHFISDLFIIASLFLYLYTYSNSLYPFVSNAEFTEVKQNYKAVNSIPIPKQKIPTCHRRCLFVLTTSDHPAIPWPLPPRGRPTLMPSIPIVSRSHSWHTIPPASARRDGTISSIFSMKSASVEESVRSYFSFKTAGSPQYVSRWMFRSCPDQ